MERPPKTPPQPFTFGSLASMNEMAGMKITQAASIDMRLGGLEGRLFRLERVVDQLCHSVPGFKGPFMEFGSERSRPGPTSEPSFVYTSAAPPMIPAVYQTASNDLKGSSRYSSSRQSVETDAHSHMSFGEGQTYIGSLHPPSSSATQAQSITITSGPTQLPSANRPTSTSTVRGATSLPAIGAARDQTDELTPSVLQSQLEAERAARQALEAQVKKLSERLNLLSSTMFAMVRDPAKSRSQERLRPDTSVTTPAPTPSPTALTSVSIPVPAGKARSVFDDDDDESTAAKEGDDYSEAFQTPREESGPANYGAFGEELKDDDDDPKRKKAARTLSLSQLTMGKGVSTRI